MESLAVTYGVTEFAFADEQFMGHGPEGVRRALGIAQELLDRKLNFTWYIETRASDIRYEVFSKLREAGLRVVFMGLESGYDLALQELRKGITVATNFAALRVLHELEILPTAGFIMFRPTTTPDEIECNLNFLEEVGCVELTALVTRLRAYSGTDFEASLRRSGQRIGASYESDWAFCDKRIEDCFRVILESADTLSASFNEFARFRRLGRLSYNECLKLQRVMNAEPIGIVRDLLREIVACGGASEETRRKTRTRFKSACEDFLRLLRLVEIVALQRQLDDGVRILSPMYLC